MARYVNLLGGAYSTSVLSSPVQNTGRAIALTPVSASNRVGFGFRLKIWLNFFTSLYLLKLKMDLVYTLPVTVGYWFEFLCSTIMTCL